jgi:hypothetical protein
MNASPLMRLRLTTAATEEIGPTPHGRLSIFPITGGSFEGERLRGIVLGGADWVTDDSALIHVTFTGVRDDANHYFRTLPRFETAAPKYAFLNRLLAVGIGEAHRDGPVHTIEEIL